MWFVFALGCMLAWGLADVCYKRGSDVSEASTHLRTVASVGILMGIYATCLLIGMDGGFDPVNFLLYLPVSLCYIGSMAVGYFGLRYLELSVSSPVQNSSGALAAILCVVFLESRPDCLTTLGIAAIFVGILLLGIWERQESVADGETDRRYISSFRALVFPLAYCVLDSLGTFLDAFYLDSPETTPLRGVTAETLEDSANIAYLYTFLAVGLICLVILLVRKEKLWVRRTPIRLLAGGLETAGQAVYVYAMSGNGAVAAPMISAYCVVSLLCSRLFLKEKLSGKKYIAIAVVILGIIVMGIAEGMKEG